MGTGESRDENVDLYFELSKPFFYAGEFIEGVAYVNAKNSTSYGALYIKLEAHEYCHWSEGSGKNRRSYTGNRLNYENEFILAKFDPTLQIGHYSFPFAIPTSANFPGSVPMNLGHGRASIFYKVKTYLADYIKNKQSHSYSYNVTLVKRPDVASTPLVGSRIGNPTICCCCQQGTTALTVNHSRNVTTDGTTIPLTIAVDNRMCKKQVNNVTVRFNRKTFAQSNGGAHRVWTQTLQTQHTPLVRPGGQDTFQMDLVVPPLGSSTTIGSIVASFYTIESQSEMDGSCYCGSDDTNVMAHIFVETRTPMLEPKQTIQAPPNWTPSMAAKQVFDIPVNFNPTMNPNIRLMNC